MEIAPDRVDERAIVVGLDGSADSQAALEWATRVARRTGRRVVAVHAIPVGETLALVPFSLVGFPDAESYGAEVLRRGVEYCRRYGVDASSRVVRGHPADVLVRAGVGAAMLVVGARSQNHAATLLLGSVSQRCAQRGRCPVVVVNASATSPVMPSDRTCSAKKAGT